MMKAVFVGFLLLVEINFALSVCPTSKDHFCYENGHESHCVGPACWHVYFDGESATTICGSSGTRQSPIDIDTSEADYDDDIEVELDEDSNVDEGGTLKNNGHSVKLIFNSDSNGNYRYKIEDVGPDDFKIVQMHFHYGTDNNQGSEHLVDGNAYCGELHAVGVHGGDYAVLGFFLQVSSGNQNNTELGKLVQHFGNINDKGDTHTITDFNLPDLVSGSMAPNKEFYRYPGSLTTPPCSEVVTWTVFATPIEISQAQIDDFRNKIILDDYSDDNYRPVQNANNEGMVVKKGQTED